MIRKIVGCALLVVSCRTMPPQETGFLIRTVTVHGNAYPYSVYVPRNFDRSHKWPVILFLHGSGERGSDGLRSTQIGAAAAIRHDPDRVPAIVVFPQAPLDTRWIGEPADAAMAALERSIVEFDGDRSHTYLTGLSMGGYGTIHLALANPKRFAALVVVCGGLFPHPTTTAVQRSPLIPADADPYAFVAQSLRNVPIWLFHGTDDTVIPVDESRHLYDALKQAGATDIHYTEYPGVGHNAWEKAYADGEMWKWMLSH
ncbi:MAG TPA: prolyl oligopeptidase family serine peptidase [Thermoanaerobaculia bacterium]